MIHGHRLIFGSHEVIHNRKSSPNPEKEYPSLVRVKLSKRRALPLSGTT
jgi:hypothetical protein